MQNDIFEVEDFRITGKIQFVDLLQFWIFECKDENQLEVTIDEEIIQELEQRFPNFQNMIAAKNLLKNIPYKEYILYQLVDIIHDYRYLRFFKV